MNQQQFSDVPLLKGQNLTVDQVDSAKNKRTKKSKKKIIKFLDKNDTNMNLTLKA